MEDTAVPKLKLRIVRNTLVVLFFGVLTFAGGYAVGVKKPEIPPIDVLSVTLDRTVPPERDINFGLFWQVWDLLDAQYYDQNKLIPADMIYGAIQGMVSAVGDPYTMFLPPEENKVTAEDLKGNFEGVGIQIGFIGTQLAVVAPLPGSPAESAGVLAGDYIVGIKDEAKDIDRGTVGITLNEAVSAIRGTEGTKVTLALLREGEELPIVLDIERKSIDVPSVTLEFVGDSEHVAHLKILKFGAETKGELDNKIVDMLAKGVDGIIIDVRNNPGGYLQGAVDIGGEFMQVGDTVVIEDRQTTKTPAKVTEHGRLVDTPIVVLMNKGSASASEILAGALRDNKGTKLVGTVSFGKGTIQERQELPEGVAVHITAARWLTPKEVWVNEVGLTPDVEVEDDPNTPEDEQLARALEVLQGEL